jgi:hypothetical protein
MTNRWQDSSWLAQAHAWIEGELARLGLRRTGAIEQPHVYPWSTVLRVPTDGGPVWFKANTESLRHEAGLVAHLAERRPDCVPPLLGADLERGWMLMADAGVRLRELQEEERNLSRWLDILPLYAGLQVDLASDADRLVALGVPDLRLAALPATYERFVSEVAVETRFRDAVPALAALCEQLAAYGVPEAIQHDDLHDGQVFVRDGRYLLMDWGDACVSHPFCTLSVTLEGVLSWGLDDVEGSVDIAPFRDAYLRPWADVSDGDLVRACELAQRVGWAARAVNGHVPGDEQSTHARLAMFLDGRVD